jgi:hypothetical protein
MARRSVAGVSVDDLRTAYQVSRDLRSRVPGIDQGHGAGRTAAQRGQQLVTNRRAERFATLFGTSATAWSTRSATSS